MTPTSSSDALTAEQAAPAGAPSRSPALLLRRIATRLAGAVIVLVGAATAAFFAQIAIPGDRATAILNIRAGQAIERTPEELAPIVEAYGLDRIVLVQYLDYLRGLFAGDLGLSYQQHRPVIDIVGEQLWPTIALTLAALVFAWALMIVWVTLTAGRGPRVRAAGSFAETLVAGLPHYWLGIILLLVFALGLGWFPVIGGTGLHGIVLPALTLAIPLAGFMGQATRTEFERSLEQPFALTARTRGMSDTGVRLRHVLRHAVLPAVTLSGWALGATISGAVVAEAVFARPGIGSVLVAAVNTQDMPVVLGIVMLVAAFYVVANLAVDLAYTLVDPRLKAS